MFSEEVFEITRGDYKTTIICKFDNRGFLISHSSSSVPLENEMMKILKAALHTAIDTGQYEEAAEIQSKINKVRTAENQKPTL